MNEPKVRAVLDYCYNLANTATLLWISSEADEEDLYAALGRIISSIEELTDDDLGPS